MPFSTNHTADELRATIERSGMDLSLCANCSKLVIVIPDGISNYCEPCIDAETERQNPGAEVAPTAGAQ